MSSFTTKLIITPLNDGKRWELIRPFTYERRYLGSGEKIKVPAGFITDFASVPRIFWRIIPPWGRYGKAAVLHDYLYSIHYGTRKKSDGVFLEAMESLGVPWWKRKIMYRAVRMFGWRSWNREGEKMKKLLLIIALLLGSSIIKAEGLKDHVNLTLLDHVSPVVQIASGESREAVVDSVIQFGSHKGKSILDGQLGYAGFVDRDDKGHFIGGAFLKLSTFLGSDSLFPAHWRFLKSIEHGPAYFYDFDSDKDYLGYQIGLAFQLNPKN